MKGEVNPLERAYSFIEIKAAREEGDKRIIEGIATTPSVDRIGDVVDPMGASYNLPLPLLWQHRSGEPVGHVVSAKQTKDGITFKAELPLIEEEGELKSMVDKAWQAVKHKLVRAVSIGFVIDAYEIMKSGGWRINEWTWLELSLVTIPANADATITGIRSLDQVQLAASGKLPADERSVSARARAQRQSGVAALKGTTMKKSLAEQIAAFTNTRAAKAARMEQLMEEAGERGETLNSEEAQEYDALESELKEIDAHLRRLEVMQRRQVSESVRVEGGTPGAASESRSQPEGSARAAIRVSITPKKVEPGMAFTRFVIAQARAKGILGDAIEIVKGNEQWMAETPQVLDALTVQRAAVSAGTTTDSTWAGPLVNYQILVQEFAEYLRPLTIIGRIPGLRRVPFKVKVPRATGGSTVNWVGEAKVKPLSSLAFDSVSLDYAKIAGIVPLTEELVRASAPSAELIVRNDLAAAVVQFMDSQFVDPSKAANDVSPASITNGVTAIVPSGTTASALRSDVRRLIAAFLTANMNLNNAVWIMTQQNALGISLLTNSLGQPEFPTITPTGGVFLGLPVIASENIPSTTGSPAEGWPIILAKADEILLADDGEVTIDASREASLQMDSAPDSPPTASTVLVSLWQHNMIAIKAERFINWAKRRSAAVQYIQASVYTG